jgi:UDP-N-acetylmuramate dehydrogenase
MNFIQNFDLTPFNTFRIQAFAQYYAAFDSIASLKNLLQNISKKPITVLGGGSNILLTGDVQGTVLHNQIMGREVISEDENCVVVRVGAGENWHEFVLYALDNNWGGIENLSLIPGCVGASPMQNIGAYGVEIKEVLEEVEALHVQTLELHKFSNEACKFGYRESVFKRELKGQYIITHVSFRLSKQAKINADYGVIQDVLKQHGVTHPTIQDISRAVIEIRSSKLPDPKELGNAGSFFKNPIVPKSLYLKIKRSFPLVPSYPVDKDTLKIPAGWLIESAGWKGKKIGNCGVHEKQALVLVNFGGASGREILELSEAIIQDVKQKFGIELEREVNLL